MFRERDLRDQRVDDLAWVFAIRIAIGSDDRKIEKSALWIVENAFEEIGLWTANRNERDGFLVIGPRGFAGLADSAPQWAEDPPEWLERLTFGYVTADLHWIVGVTSERLSRLTLNGLGDGHVVTDHVGSFVIPRPDGLPEQSRWELLSPKGIAVGMGGHL